MRGRGPRAAPDHRPAARLRGRPRARALDAARRRHRVRRAVVERARARPRTYDEAYHRLVYTADFWHEWLSRGEFPDHPWRTYLQRSALTLKGLTYAPTGAMVAAATTSLPETPGGAAQLGLPLLVDPRLHVHALGPLHARASTRRPTTSSTSSATWSAARTTRCRSCTGSAASASCPSRRSTTSTATRTPARCGSATAPTTSASTTSGARCWTRSTCTRSRATGWPSRPGRSSCKQVEDAIAHWREPDRGIWEVRGEPRHFTSSKLMCWVALRPRRAPGAAARGQRARRRAGRTSADEIHADVCANAVDERGVFTQHYETDALDASCLLIPLVRFLPPDDERVDRHGQRDRRGADRGRPRAALQGLRDRRRARRRRGLVRDLLVLAGQRAGRDRRDDPRPGAVREAARLRLAARPVRRGDRPALRPPPGQLPAGLHPPGAHQRGHARHPRRRAGWRASGRCSSRAGRSCRRRERASSSRGSSTATPPRRARPRSSPSPSTARARSTARRTSRCPAARPSPSTGCSGRSCPTGATCTCGTATSAACRSTTPSPRTGWPPGRSIAPDATGTRCRPTSGCDEAARRLRRGARRHGARRRPERDGARRPHRVAVPRAPAAARGGHRGARARLAQAAARPRHADAAEAQRVAAHRAARDRRRQGADARARVIAGPDPDVPASLLDRDKLEIIADTAALGE